MVEASKPGAKPRLVKLSLEEIKQKPGHFDKDGFYLLDEGGFFDPEGFHYDKDGVDAVGGFYDASGVYIAPRRAAGVDTFNEDGRSVLCVKLLKEEIEAIEGGNYDEDGFYILPDKSFYDPLGYFFDQDGNDTVGGRYDEEGFYVHPPSYANEAAYGEDLEDYTLDDDYDNEEDYGEEETQPHMQDDDFERQAVMHEHIMPAQLYVKTQLEKDPNLVFYVRVNNFPDLYQERNVLRFLTKKIPGFAHSKLILEKDRHDNFTGSVLIQPKDRATINALLLLHDYRLQGYNLQSWLMGFEYDASSLQMMGAGTGSSLMLEDDMGSMEKYEKIFSQVKSVEATSHQNRLTAKNPEVERKQHAPVAKSVTTQDGEFEVTSVMAPATQKPKTPAPEDDGEFQVTRIGQ